MYLTITRLIQKSGQIRNVVNGKWTTTHYTQKPRENDPRWKDVDMTRVSDDYDVLIIGGGPAGMSTAIRLKQLAIEQDKEIRVCVVEKASEPVVSQLEGNGFSIRQEVKGESIAILTEKRRFPIPIFPGIPLANHGNYIVRLGHVVKWLAEKAEELGVEIYRE
uniref:Electron transfer flavoprotein-ubiquinone oxidoreductase n=1 Tax=Ditylenchus dipsaci TaxID=166011 RepID=A0A915DWX4_9BILA